MLGVGCGSIIAISCIDKEAVIPAKANGRSEQKEIVIDTAPNEIQIGFSSEIIDLTDDTGQNYYVNYRIKREQSRQETKDMLRLLLESDIRQTREQAQQRWLDLSSKISKEGEIENVLKMKGFKDVVSEVNSQKASITVLAQKLTLQEIYIIKRTATDITGFPADNIQVTARA
ncbi:MAG: SpoIIIAH-like family protein [Peptococcaceae bacterium]|nr:SpoIIIAH-like family protein [Peptococcaceae bacterium]